MAGAKIQHFSEYSKCYLISCISIIYKAGTIFAIAQFRLQTSYLPPVFTLDLFENRDVRNGCKEQDTGTELDGISPEDFVG